MDACDLFIMSGGAGTRLWPFSRESHPKQLLDLTHENEPLIVQTIHRLLPFGNVRIITTKSVGQSTLGLLNRYASQPGYESMSKIKTIEEPLMRNTAAAVLLAAKVSALSEPKRIVGIFPSDHVIKHPKVLQNALALAVEQAQRGRVVTLGITPTYPATAYGYIQLQSDFSRNSALEVLEVEGFVEKPNEERATRLLQTGRSVWNAGMFVFSASVMIDLFRKHQPDFYNAFAELKPDLSNMREIYEKLPNVSIDVAIMEKLSNLVCIPVDMGWSDVGCWEEVARLNGNLGIAQQIQGSGNFYLSLPDDKKKQVAFLGVSDTYVLETSDAMLVMKKGCGQNVREVVEGFKTPQTEQILKIHDFEIRPWGKFEILKDDEHFKVKRISVEPGQRLSYQSHTRRTEHWTIVRGEAEVTLDDVIHRLKVGEHIFIPLLAKHRIANKGKAPLEFIEVQTGSYFGEDDIKRYSDEYGRA